MLLIRLSGHAGAGKSRLIASLPDRKATCPRSILYTSRPAREREVHGKDYYFLSRSSIAALPDEHFFKGRVREMLQAVDLKQLETDLWASDVVLIEIFADLWPGLFGRLQDYMLIDVPSRSVFMTAVDPKEIKRKKTEKRKADLIRTRVEQILTRRNKDTPDRVKSRAKTAVKEVLEAIGPDGKDLYAKVFYSSPEGPDGDDEWTQPGGPVGRAATVLNQFVKFYESATKL